MQVPADDVEAVATLMSQRGNEVAAIMTEPVQGAGGVYPPHDGYLQSLRKLCDQHGAYLVFDEVITGFGRTGSWFAAHHYGVTPDIATFAKGVTSGYIPLGGVFVGAAPTAALESDPDFFLRHGFTYSGHPTACAAGLKNLEIIRRRGSGRACQAHRGPAGRRPAGTRRRRRHRPRPRRRRHVGRSALRADQDAKAIRDHMLDTSGVIVRALADGLVHVSSAGHSRRAHRSAGRCGRRGGRLT